MKLPMKVETVDEIDAIFKRVIVYICVGFVGVLALDAWRRSVEKETDRASEAWWTAAVDRYQSGEKKKSDDVLESYNSSVQSALRSLRVAAEVCESKSDARTIIYAAERLDELRKSRPRDGVYVSLNLFDWLYAGKNEYFDLPKLKSEAARLRTEIDLMLER